MRLDSILMAKKAQDYTDMMRELDNLLADMQVENLDIDTVIAKYERGQQLLLQLKKYLESSENKVLHHKLPSNTGSD